ncbi:hypothetical protein HMPREF9163_00670 [Selenomonas sp. oral taxon 138 str. F0429]|nr:hypothetical protein HMPREF9163_00670 [Selenomonas sp. oral taxon 138 str. F0429]
MNQIHVCGFIHRHYKYLYSFSITFSTIACLLRKSYLYFLQSSRSSNFYNLSYIYSLFIFTYNFSL